MLHIISHIVYRFACYLIHYSTPRYEKKPSSLRSIPNSNDTLAFWGRRTNFCYCTQSLVWRTVCFANQWSCTKLENRRERETMSSRELKNLNQLIIMSVSIVVTIKPEQNNTVSSVNSVIRPNQTIIVVAHENFYAYDQVLAFLHFK